MAKVSTYRVQPDSLNLLDLLEFSNDSRPDFKCDLENLICDNKCDKEDFINSSLWSNCADDLVTALQSDDKLNSVETVSLSALAKNHFLTNDISEKNVHTNSSPNSVNTLADFFLATCFEQGNSCSSSSENGEREAIEIGADVFVEANNDWNKSCFYEINLDNCLKYDLNEKRTESISCISFPPQYEEISRKQDFLSLEIKKLELKPSAIDSGSNKADSRELYAAENAKRANVKPSLFAKALSYKRKTDESLKQKVSKIEMELADKYSCLTQFAPVKCKRENGQNSLAENIDKAVLCDLIGRYKYGTE